MKLVYIGILLIPVISIFASFVMNKMRIKAARQAGDSNAESEYRANAKMMLIVGIALALVLLPSAIAFPSHYENINRPQDIFTRVPRNRPIESVNLQFNQDGTVRFNRDGSLALTYRFGDRPMRSTVTSPPNNWTEVFWGMRFVLHVVIPSLAIGVAVVFLFFAARNKKAHSIGVVVGLILCVGLNFVGHAMIFTGIPAFYYNRAERHLENGEYAQAIALFDQYRHRDSHRRILETFYRLGESLTLQGEFLAASGAFAQASRGQSTFQDARERQISVLSYGGQELMNNGELYEALEILLLAGDYGDTSNILLALGDMFLENNDIDNAMAAFEAARGLGNPYARVRISNIVGLHDGGVLANADGVYWAYRIQGTGRNQRIWNYFIVIENSLMVAVGRVVGGATNPEGALEMFDTWIVDENRRTLQIVFDENQQLYEVTSAPRTARFIFDSDDSIIVTNAHTDGFSLTMSNSGRLMRDTPYVRIR